MFVDMQHPRAGKVTITGNPIKLSADEYRAPQASPALGEHSLAILQKHLGIDAEMFQTLQREGVL